MPQAEKPKLEAFEGIPSTVAHLMPSQATPAIKSGVNSSKEYNVDTETERRARLLIGRGVASGAESVKPKSSKPSWMK